MVKKILMVVAPIDFRDEECLEPKEVFEKAGFEVKFASDGVEEATGAGGAVVPVDMDLTEVDVEDFDAIVFVGGGGSQVYFNDKNALKIAREFYERGKITAAICIAPVILAEAGVLKNKKATVWDSGNRSVIEMIEEKEARYTGKDVEQDGIVITANGPHAAKEFGEIIVKALED